MGRTYKIKFMQKKGLVPNKCGNCKSSKIEYSPIKEGELNGEKVIWKGWHCQNCNFENLKPYKI